MATQFRSVRELAEKIAQDSTLENKIKADPAGVIASLAAPLQSDVWIYRIVVGAMGLTILIALLGAIVLKAWGADIPDVLTALGSAAVGALAGLLAPSPTINQ
jgi:hypothetical protein